MFMSTRVSNWLRTDAETSGGFLARRRRIRRERRRKGSNRETESF